MNKETRCEGKSLTKYVDEVRMPITIERVGKPDPASGVLYVHIPADAPPNDAPDM